MLAQRLLPDDDEVSGLLALLLLQHSRRAARADAGGTAIPMEEQDRGRWDLTMINEALTVLGAVRRRRRPAGRYVLQAEIAACHAVVDNAGDTDWSRVVDLYDQLLIALPSPVIELNRAVAVSYRDGPVSGLQTLAEVAERPPLRGYWLVPVVRADLLRRAGRWADAAAAYRDALAGTPTAPERRLLRRRLAEVSERI